MSMTNDRQPRGRVLVVEDAFLVASLIEEALTDQGFEITGPFAKLDQAIKAALTERVDAAVLDINLQGERVYPLADLLIEASIPVVLCTGYGGETIPPQYSKLSRLEKPFTPEAVGSAVAQVLDGSVTDVPRP